MTRGIAGSSRFSRILSVHATVAETSLPDTAVAASDDRRSQSYSLAASRDEHHHDADIKRRRRAYANIYSLYNLGRPDHVIAARWLSGRLAAVLAPVSRVAMHHQQQHCSSSSSSSSVYDNQHCQPVTSRAIECPLETANILITNRFNVTVRFDIDVINRCV